jgi:adenylosuccinate synthase
MVNGTTEIWIMKGDVLDVFDDVKICTSYLEDAGNIQYELPYDLVHTPAAPVFYSMEGWPSGLGKASNWTDLPNSFKRYCQFVEEQLGVPVSHISTGPGREQTIVR